jgi:hypothetical protein
MTPLIATEPPPPVSATLEFLLAQLMMWIYADTAELSGGHVVVAQGVHCENDVSVTASGFDHILIGVANPNNISLHLSASHSGPVQIGDYEGKPPRCRRKGTSVLLARTTSIEAMKSTLRDVLLTWRELLSELRESAGRRHWSK